MQSRELTEALVVTTFGRRLELRLDGNERVSARVKGRRLRPVCGDRVLTEPIPRESDWLVTAILPRANELARPDSRGRREVLAANLTFLAVVAADPPKPDWFIVDRYLCAAELMGVDAAIVFNKSDLVAGDDPSAAVLAEYEKISYPVVRCSALTGRRIDRVGELLRDQVAILVGQSGVGKSSIINRISDDPLLRTGAVSEKSGEGRHTTVNSAMLRLPLGGSVIDSPGVRDYAPSLEASDQPAAGFREIAAAAAGCRYANCRHLREPGCAVKAAVDTLDISPRRYESYKRLVNLAARLPPSRH